MSTTKKNTHSRLSPIDRAKVAEAKHRDAVEARERGHANVPQPLPKRRTTGAAKSSGPRARPKTPTTKPAAAARLPVLVVIEGERLQRVEATAKRLGMTPAAFVDRAIGVGLDAVETFRGIGRPGG